MWVLTLITSVNKIAGFDGCHRVGVLQIVESSFRAAQGGEDAKVCWVGFDEVIGHRLLQGFMENAVEISDRLRRIL